MNNPLNRIDPDGRVIWLLGTGEQRKKELEFIRGNLRPEDRKYVSMDKHGIVIVDSKAKGSLGLMMLKDVAGSPIRVNVRLGSTYRARDSVS